MIDLSEKIILITGASRGIGAVTALTLSQVKAKLILQYNQGVEEINSIAEQIGRENCCLIQADLSLPNAVINLWQEAIAWQGKIDVVVNNAAIMPAASIEDDFDMWLEATQNTLQVNLVAVAIVCREAIRHFQTRQTGIIINIASRAAFRGDGIEYMHYAASKGGVIALTRSIARGFAKDNILAFAIAPGFVHTDRIEEVMAEKGRDYVTKDK